MIVILDNLRSAQNVGSIIRTCDAFDVDEIYLSGITPDNKNKKVLKTSLGAEKNIKIYTSNSTQEVLPKIRKQGFKIIALEIDQNSADINKFNDAGDFAIIVGNEISGLSQEIIGLCDYCLHIPMQGIKESLNVAVAFGIAVFALSNRKTCTSK